jgi:hypothetical protein
LEPWVIGSSRDAVPTGTARDANRCVQHRQEIKITAQTGLVCPALHSIPTLLRRVEGAETLSKRPAPKLNLIFIIQNFHATQNIFERSAA